MFCQFFDSIDRNSSYNYIHVNLNLDFNQFYNVIPNLVDKFKFVRNISIIIITIRLNLRIHSVGDSVLKKKGGLILYFSSSIFLINRFESIKFDSNSFSTIFPKVPTIFFSSSFRLDK